MPGVCSPENEDQEKQLFQHNVSDEIIAVELNQMYPIRVCTTLCFGLFILARAVCSDAIRNKGVCQSLSHEHDYKCTFAGTRIFLRPRTRSLPHL